jgi:trans-aconitate methyltransferase
MTLLERWDAQQAAYIAQREQRFDVIVELVRRVAGPAPRVLDLACGPGSLSARILDALPQARVVGVDLDPALLRIARRELAPRGERLALVDADLAGDAWIDAVRQAAATASAGDDGPARFDAAVSTTALHWLAPHQLVRLYGQVAGLLAPGGILANGDHFRFDAAEHPTLARVAAEHDRATQEAAFAAGAPTWDAWWDEVRAEPGGAALLAERDQRFAGRDAPPTTTIGFHVAALRQAGFAEVAPAWQLLDDYVVVGRTAGGRP